MAKDEIELLEELGLTEYESKTLHTIFKLREAEAPEISREAQVPKTRVYDVLERLVDKNLIIEIKGRPKIYRTIDPEMAINTLVEYKKSDLKKLEEQAAILKDSIILYNKVDAIGEKVMKVKNKLDFERILGQELAKAENKITGLTEIDEENEHIHNAIKGAKARNIDIKLLNHKPTQKLKENATVRHFDHGMNAFVIDNKKVILALSDFKKKKNDYHFTIMNDNKAMAEALNAYMENKWQHGKEY